MTTWLRPGADAGAPMAELEKRIADLLGKEAALFFPTGTMAQQAALRIHADRTGRRTFAAHPQCHLVVWEEQGYSAVHGLRHHAVGDFHGLVALEHLHQVREPLAALVLELPQRDLGGLVPTWDELTAQTSWVRERGGAAHLDGARLWEAQTAYGRPFAEIAALFDSVYVSLYKGLHGISGAVLSGDQGMIDEASVWRTRLGGTVLDTWPMAVTALIGMDEMLPRMPEFRDHARALAAAINADGLASTLPERPDTPIFHVQLPAPPSVVERAARTILERDGIQLFGRIRTTPDPTSCTFEVIVGVHAMDFSPAEVVGLLHRLCG